jgi:hypothetical protein
VSLTFVVGTSRCGSKMLSRMLYKHPEVLSVSEFWNCFMDTEGSIPTHDMTGEEFWLRLTTPASGYDGLISAGIKQDDLLTSYTSRFDHAASVPPFSRVLGWSTEESPDPLFDELARVVPGWPSRPVADHCRALFGELAVRRGRRVIVERTGGSLGYVKQLREMFPEALFVFLHRDGPDTALSMSRYPTLRLHALRILAETLDIASPEELERIPAEIRGTGSEEFRGLTEPPFDKERFLAFPIPLSFFSWLWSDMTRDGTRNIRAVPRDRILTLRYERLLDNNQSELARLAAFIGVDADRQWLDETFALADPGRAGSASAQLHPGELGTLRGICAAGARAFDLLESECAAAAGRR